MRNRVLGVDPGFDRVGIAVLEKEGDKEKLLFSTCIQTDRKDSHEDRLFHIGKTLEEILLEWKPNSLAIEQLFFNQNTTNALKVSEARGVMLYEARRAGLNVFEYSPQAIKVAVTGSGRADKRQVAQMVKKLLNLKDSLDKKLDDEIDAIAVGITHLASRNRI